MLGVEAATVIGQRSLKLAAGGRAAETEAQRCLREKVDAAIGWQILAMTGGLGASAPTVAAKTLRHYRRKVRANRRRLGKS
jgi:hypothetical protein